MALSDGERATLVAAQEALQGQVSTLQLELQQARQQHDAAAARARESSDVQSQLTEELATARQSHAAAEKELEGGESAVAQLLQQQQLVAEALAGERSALVAKNAALTAQMQATQAALQRLQESAAEALHSASRENDELAARNAQLAKEMEALSGKDGAALAPALAEARAQLAAMQERCAQLAASNAQLEQELQNGRGGSATGEHTVLQARLAAINETFDSIGLHANGREPSEGGATDDTASEIAFSDIASVAGSEAPGMTDAQRAANRLRSSQNKAKFDAIKAERNAFKQEAKKAAKELERMRTEVAKVEELKNQLKALQDNMYV
jgi:chromosome segregation ATPase